MSLHASADVKLHVVFGPQTVFSLTALSSRTVSF
jgi:hypothetical protein